MLDVLVLAGLALHDGGPAERTDLRGRRILELAFALGLALALVLAFALGVRRGLVVAALASDAEERASDERQKEVRAVRGRHGART